MSELSNAIAIVGLAGRFPGADSVAELWRNLVAGVESVTFFEDDELIAAGVDPAAVADPSYVKAAARLAHPELFDAEFFGIPPREAELIDPQQRVFLECAWEVLEDAGVDPERFDGSIGVFAGSGKSHYLVHHLLPNPAVLEAMGPVAAVVASEKDFVATRVAYKLNLRGPAVAVQTACSTSLVAVHVACQSLLEQECDLALAGGVSISSLRPEGYLYVEDGIFSPDGHLRAFDAAAAGQIGGNGAALVALRRLEDALADGDTVRAVILGSAVNNDGRNKVSFTAPGVEGQAGVVAEALEVAGVDPRSIGYIECHGTGTLLGDPIEVAALTQAFRAGTADRGFCRLGSLKSNVGHLDAAAGAAGLIKAALSLEHETIPASLHFETPNPELKLETSPFQVAGEQQPWPRGTEARRAGVSSFGIGGTNAHAVLQEAPAPVPTTPSRPVQLLTLSARTPQALDAASARLAERLTDTPGLVLADVAHTLHVGRRTFAERRALVCRDRDEALRLLGTGGGRRAASERPKVAFLFSGQGAQYPDMTRGLYDSEPTYRRELDRACAALEPHVGLDLRELLFPPPGRRQEAARDLALTQYTQPALFAVEVALARLWMEWGVEPDAMLGHSIGDYVAAHLAGVLSLADAARIVAARGRLIGSLPEGGGMLAVHLPEEQLVARIGDGLALAAINAPELCVVSGPLPALERLEGELGPEGVSTRRLHTSHAFHSSAVDPILEPFAEEATEVHWSVPERRFVHSSTGAWAGDEVQDPRTWVRHVREPVRFADGVKTLVDDGVRVLVEIGPGHGLASLASLCAGAEDVLAVASTRHPREQADDEAVLLGALGELWSAGVEVDWTGFHAHERRRRVPLPTYPFERRRYWIERPRDGEVQAAPERRRSDVADWTYVPSWRLLPPTLGRETADGERWLVVADGTELAERIAAELESAGAEALVVRPAGAFAERGPRSFELDASSVEDWRRLFAVLAERRVRPSATLVLAATAKVSEEELLERAFHGPLALAQALAELGPEAPPRLVLVSAGAQDVLGERVTPAAATVLGPAKAVDAELADVACRLVDLAADAEPDAAQALVREIREPSPEPVVALRGEQRWAPAFAPVRLEASKDPVVREGAVVLVTGGLGGVGFTLAEHLAQTAGARLVLVGRSPLPAAEARQAWVEEHGPDDRASRRLARLARLEQAGAEVLCVAADVADTEQLRVAVAAAKERFGAVHAVIHAAGLPGDGLLALKTRAEAERVLAPKVRGTRALEEALQGEELDLVCLCSSLATSLAGVGQVDYFAANAYLDARAHAPWEGAARLVTIAWDAWREVGMAVETDVPEALRAGREASLRLGLSPAEGCEVFRRALASGLPHVLVSTRDLERRAAARADVPAAAEEEVAAAPVATGRHPRPALPTDYVAPRNETERGIAAVWADLLGIEEVGVHDDFFELGGNSLLMMQVSVRLRETHEVSIPMRTLFETPDVASLAERVDSLRLASEVGAEVEAAHETEEFRL